LLSACRRLAGANDCASPSGGGFREQASSRAFGGLYACNQPRSGDTKQPKTSVSHSIHLYHSLSRGFFVARGERLTSLARVNMLRHGLVAARRGLKRLTSHPSTNRRLKRGSENSSTHLARPRYGRDGPGDATRMQWVIEAVRLYQQLGTLAGYRHSQVTDSLHSRAVDELATYGSIQGSL
jgi:hypothetical protein